MASLGESFGSRQAAGLEARVVRRIQGHSGLRRNCGDTCPSPGDITAASPEARWTLALRPCVARPPQCTPRRVTAEHRLARRSRAEAAWRGFSRPAHALRNHLLGSPLRNKRFFFLRHRRGHLNFYSPQRLPFPELRFKLRFGSGSCLGWFPTAHFVTHASIEHAC